MLKGENKIEYIKYKDQIIYYKIEKTKNKHIYIQIKEGVVIVKLPNKVSNKYAKEIVLKKAEWIINRLNEKEKEEIEEKSIDKSDIDRLQKIVENNIQKYGSKIGRFPKSVRIRNIKYAWGSCSSNSNITISMKLAKKEEKAIEYVVLHEMCHLVHMNHSKKFWDLVEENMPEYKEIRTKLKSKK